MRRNYNNSSAFVSPRINIPKALQLILAKGIFIYFDLFSKKKKKRGKQTVVNDGRIQRLIAGAFLSEGIRHLFVILLMKNVRTPT